MTFLTGPLLADTVVLRSGETLICRIVGQTQTTITVRLENGARRTLQKSAINRLGYDSLDLQRDEQRRQADEQRKQEEARRRAEAAAAAAAAANAANQSQQPDVESGRPGLWGILGRSALIPGWGHYAMGEDTTAAVYAGGAAVLGGFLIARRQSARAAQARNEQDVLTNYALAASPEAPLPIERIFLSIYANNLALGGYQDRVDRYQNTLTLFGFFYLFQILHAAYDYEWNQTAQARRDSQWQLVAGWRPAPGAAPQLHVRRYNLEGYGEAGYLWRY
ncbi:MAG: hypothetical protein K1X75_09480 [Leptospirales bacterium]|nr:hypothetical protein [Leptospirales bacterium]